MSDKNPTNRDYKIHGGSVHIRASRGHIALIWSITDVLDVQPNLTKEQAWQVLELVAKNHDRDFGVHWDRIACAVQDLFGDVPETSRS
jgi:hypothetical protein